MGMFDKIDFEMVCPCCGRIIKDFQSKDSDCTMSTLEPWEVSNFYSFCNKCNLWVEFTLKPNNDIKSISRIFSAAKELTIAMCNLKGESYTTDRLEKTIELTIGHTWLELYDLTISPPGK